MSKKILAHFDNNENKIIIDSDDVHSGDYIDLTNLSSLDNFIKFEINSKYKDSIINDFKNNSNEYLNLNKTIKQLQDDLTKKDNEIKNLPLEITNNFKQSQEYKDLEEYKLKYKELFATNQAIIDLEKQKLNNEYKNKINDLNNQITDLIKENKHIKIDYENKLENKIKDFKLSDEYKQLENLKFEYELKIKTVEEQYKDQLNEKDKKISELNRDNKTIKLVGEDLEIYCKKEYDNNLSTILEDSLFVKTNKSIDGTKPDFSFSIYTESIGNKVNDEKWLDDHLLSKAIFEMKSELENSVHRQKNSDFLKKLELDRIKNNAEIAVLVTELEKDDNFLVKRNPEYPEIYIIRPVIFVAFIGLFRSMALKRRAIKLAELEFKDKHEILDEFNKFKDELLKNQFDKINKKTNEIKKEAEKIKRSAELILEDVGIISETHLHTAINKIEAFKIEKKVTDKISNIVNKLELKK